MKMRRLLGLIALIGASVLVGSLITARAQNTAFSIQIAPGTTSANCAVVASQTTYCFTGGGILYVSINGAAFAAYTATSSAGVTSFNGKTGDITYTPPAAPVTSVNGKTGAVTLTLN